MKVDFHVVDPGDGDACERLESESHFLATWLLDEKQAASQQSGLVHESAPYSEGFVQKAEILRSPGACPADLAASRTILAWLRSPANQSLPPLWRGSAARAAADRTCPFERDSHVTETVSGTLNGYAQAAPFSDSSRSSPAAPAGRFSSSRAAAGKPGSSQAIRNRPAFKRPPPDGPSSPTTRRGPFLPRCPRAHSVTRPPSWM